jgi:predicted DNA-binding transcriptional regulator AlpA
MTRTREHSAHRLLTVAEAGEYLGKPAKTLDNWRSARTGPPYYRVGGSIRYALDDLNDWLAEQRVKPGVA